MDKIIVFCVVALTFVVMASAFCISLQLDRIEIAYKENPISREWHKTYVSEKMDIEVKPGATLIVNEGANDEPDN